HFSQIFGLYPDPERAADRAFEAAEAKKPDLEGATADGTMHRLWRVTDRATLAAVAGVIAKKNIYIADGHHRYETMLALRDEFRAAGDGVRTDPASAPGEVRKVAPRASTEFATMFLANMDDPGLVVLPTHRLVHSLLHFHPAAILKKAGE